MIGDSFDEEYVDPHGECAVEVKLLGDTIVELIAALNAASGYLLNAKIDLETGRTKATAIKTIDGGLALVRSALLKAGGAG